jgi:two-component system, response regulator
MNNKIILLVEDNQSDIALTKRAFKKANIANPLQVAEDGQEALDFLFAEGPFSQRDKNDLPTIVLLDLKLPIVDGLEVLKAIRGNALTKRLPVVVLTSSKEEMDLAISYDLGVNSYIRKPVDFTQFAEVIKQLGLYWLVLNEAPPQPL